MNPLAGLTEVTTGEVVATVGVLLQGCQHSIIYCFIKKQEKSKSSLRFY
jgi:hypothetical protein